MLSTRFLHVTLNFDIIPQFQFARNNKGIKIGQTGYYTNSTLRCHSRKYSQTLNSKKNIIPAWPFSAFALEALRKI
jgi:hypothetical protein